MKNSAFTPVVCVLALALGGWGTWEHLRRSALETELAAVRGERDTLVKTASAKIALRAGTEVDPKGPRGLNADGSPLPAEKDAESGAKADKTPNPAEGMAKMMKDPAMREAIKAQTRTQMEMMFRDLFDMLALSPDQQNALEKVLADRQNAMIDGGMAMWTGEKPTEEQAKAMKDAAEDSKAKIKEVLGEEKYSQFERYEESQGERMQLKTFSGMLKDKGLNLSEESETKLMDAMFEERKNTKFDTDLQKPENIGNVTAEAIEQYATQSEALRGRILSRAEGILNEQEMTVFRTAQEQQAKMEEMGMKMTKEMLGGRAKTPDTAN